jgi:hypothetical protein
MPWIRNTAHKGVERTETMLAKSNLTQNFSKKIKFLRLEIMPAGKL